MEFLLQLMIDRVSKSLIKRSEEETTLSCEEKKKKLNLILKG